LIDRVSKREKISWRFYMGIFRWSLFTDSPPFYFHQNKLKTAINPGSK